MNGVLSNILVGGISLAIGAAGGYFYAKKTLEDHLYSEMEKRINDEIDRLAQRNHIETRELHKPGSPERAKDREKSMEQAIEKYNAATKSSPNPYKLALQKQMMDDDPYDGSEPEEDPEEPEFDAEEDEAHLTMSQWNQEPEVVDEETFINLPPYFTSVTFQYFDEDDTLIDEVEEPVIDPELYVGDALNRFGELCDNPDHVYVVNGSMGLAVEVIRLHASYAKWVGFEF